MPQISIITTTYKHEKYILETIKSIQSQRFYDWELLIGDDSPDTLTENIVLPLLDSDTRIKYWHHTPNKWVVENMNFLLSQVDSESQYIAFLEWDDLYTPDNLLKKLEIFEKYPEVKLVYNELDFVNADSKTLISQYLKYRKIPFFQNQKISPDVFLAYTAWPIASRSTWMIDKSVLSICKIRSFATDKKAYQVSDYDFYFQVATQYPVYWIKASLTKYRRHENNLSWSNGWTSEDLEKLIKQYHHTKQISQETYNNKMSRIQIVYAFSAFEGWHKKQWLSRLIQSWKYKKTSYLLHKTFLLRIYVLPVSLWKKIIQKLIGRN